MEGEVEDLGIRSDFLGEVKDSLVEFLLLLFFVQCLKKDRHLPLHLLLRLRHQASTSPPPPSSSPIPDKPSSLSPPPPSPSLFLDTLSLEATSTFFASFISFFSSIASGFDPAQLANAATKVGHSILNAPRERQERQVPRRP